MDPRLRAAVDESVCWYDELFALHSVGCGISDGLWASHGPPPPLHSAAKSVEPSVRSAAALRAVAAYEHCSIADSFGALDLGDEMDLLFEARWLHRPPLDAALTPLPAGWETVTTGADLAVWTAIHGTSDVLLPGLLRRSSFQFLGHRSNGELTAGGVTHLGAGVVGLSNVWAAPGHEVDWGELVRVVHALHPGRAVVGYEQGEDLAHALAAGFNAVGPQLVWVR